MKVAITGGAGFLGREVVSLLQNNDSFEPVTLSRKLLNTKDKYEFRITDYSSESLDMVLRDVDAVVHLAAIRGAEGKISDFHQNEILTENIYRSCVKLGIENIVFASSIAVYSDASKISWCESHIPTPKTLYGISKIACEYIGQIYHKKYGLNIKSLRIAQILGEGEKKGMMNTFIDNAFDKTKLKVIGKSIAKREYVYVKDVARAIECSLMKSKINGSFNIGSGQAFTNLEVAQIVNDCFGNQENLVYENSLDEGIESSLMDSSKAKRVLGYEPKFSFKEALNDIKYIKEQSV